MSKFVQITMNDISFGVSQMLGALSTFVSPDKTDSPSSPVVQNAYPFLMLLPKHERRP